MGKLTLFCKRERHGSSFFDDGSFDALLDCWLSSIRLRVKKSTYSTYSGVAARYIRPALGRRDAEALTDRELEVFLAAAALDYSAGTVRMVCNILRSALAFAQEQGRCRELGAALSAPRGERGEARVLNPEEQRRLEGWLRRPGGPEELGILICMHTGIRLGEICALRWGDFSEDGRVMYIRRTLQRLPVGGEGPKTALVFDTPKSRSSTRRIPVPAQLCARIAEQRRGADCYVLTGTEQPMEPRRFQRRFKAALRAAGVPDINFHALRHTFATNCVSLGCDPATLARILGHSDVSVTLNTYVHPSFEAMREIIDKTFTLC